MPDSLNLRRKLIVLALFSVAMGYLESAVVVYLRELYYPFGFKFPMETMTGRIAVTEIFREAATLIMLASIAWLAGKNFPERFSWFLLCFAIWDIFYYVFLKVILGWPASLLTWDILFLIPVVWTGPVITPVLVSLTMILMALGILTGKISTSPLNTRGLVVLGAFLVFLSFIWDFSSYMLDRYSAADLFKPGVSQNALQQYIPYRFNWWFFIAGELLIISGIAISHIKTKKIQNEG